MFQDVILDMQPYNELNYQNLNPLSASVVLI